MRSPETTPEAAPALLSGGARTAKGRATRQRILVAAAGLIHAQGVGGTSLDDVGMAAGAGKSQVYHYFTDKSELVSAVIEYQTEQVLQVGDLTTWAGWLAWRDGVVAHHAERDCGGGCPLGSLVNEIASHDAVTSRAISASFDHWEMAFRQGLQQMQLHGLLAQTAEPARLARTVLIALEGGLLLGNAHRDVAYLQHALDTAISQLWSHAPA
ncbi:TetR/AcrR family transcriptional regulator [Glaciihabitans sp. UYNi722]|uniref:TetR/AcrR family transcriptional regulator n=1 Tax=Glaciihabitans sp. UYNi722 TaxID=3156344 RepID=UPI003392094C